MLVVHNQELFGRFIQESVGHPKHEIAKKLKAVQIRMSWRATDNVTDCETLCMGRMESYFGQTDKWDCGFKKNEVSLQKCLIFKNVLT